MHNLYAQGGHQGEADEEDFLGDAVEEIQNEGLEDDGIVECVEDGAEY